jgi:hypothetical protein
LRRQEELLLHSACVFSFLLILHMELNFSALIGKLC